MAKRGVSSNPGYKPGSHWAVCDSCGFQFRAEELRETWDHRWVCDDDLEPRHPQELLKVREEKVGVDQPIRNDDTSNVGVAAPLVAIDELVFAERSADTTNSISNGFFSFVNDGAQSWQCASGGNLVSALQYSTPYDVSTMVTTATFGVLSGNQLRGLEVSSDGTKLFAGDAFSNTFKAFTIGTPYTVTTLTTVGATSYNPAEMVNVQDIKTNNDDSKFYLMDDNYTIFDYQASSPGDITSLSYSGTSFTPADMPTSPLVQCFNFNQDGTLLACYGTGTVGVGIKNIIKVYSTSEFSIAAPVLLYTLEFDQINEIPNGIDLIKVVDTINLYGQDNSPVSNFNILRFTISPGELVNSVTDQLDFTPPVGNPNFNIPSGTNNNDL